MREEVGEMLRSPAPPHPKKSVLTGDFFFIINYTFVMCTKYRLFILFIIESVMQWFRGGRAAVGNCWHAVVAVLGDGFLVCLF